MNNSIVIAEAELTSPSINAHDFLVFRVRVANTDWNQETKDSIYAAARNGTTMAIVLQPFQQEAPKQDAMAQKRSKLAYLMQKYCEQEWTRIEEETSRIYAKYSIASRTELTEWQLDKEIDSYGAWLLIWD